MPDLERDYPEYNIFGVLPSYGLYLHHAQGIILNNVRFHLEAEDLRPAIVSDDVENLELSNFQADSQRKADSLIRLQDTQAAFVTGARVLDPIGTFMRVEGHSSQRILLRGNDLSLAAEAVSASEGAPPEAVSQDVGAVATRGR